MDSRKPPYTLPSIFAEVEAELDKIPEGFVDVRIYKSNNALENHDITTHKRRKGRIAKSAEIAVN